MRALGLIAIAGLAACFPPSTYDCDQDSECSSGEVCARTHECLTPGEVRSLRVRWTIDGQTDTVTECAARAIGDLTIVFSGGSGESLTYTPVPCPGGLYFIDKLPLRFDQVELSGYAGDGTPYYGLTPVGGDPEYTLTLSEN